MTTCQSCQAQLLEYVYGLLDNNDPAEAAILTELRAHLETCPQCQAAYERAKKQQSLLGQASRVKTELTFTAPKVEPRRSSLLRQRSSYVSWYVTAASLLFALLAVTGSTYWWGKTTKWQTVEEARLHLEAAQSKPALNNKDVTNLQQQILTQATTTEQWKKALKDLEASTQTQLTGSTSYQQVLAPTDVEVNNDAPVVVTSQTLTEKPTALNEVANTVTDLGKQYSMSQLNRQSGPNSNKMLYTVPSLAFRDSIDKTLNNEVTQDISNNVLGYKINHPLNVLQAELSCHLSTDKPLYQPGEEVFFRGLALDKTNFTPVRDELEFTFTLIGPGSNDKPLKEWTHKAQLINPVTRQPLKDERGLTIQGVGGESFTLPATMPLGECQLTLTEKTGRFAQQTVKFMVNTLTAPKFDKQLQFTRASYSPGDEVLLTGKVKLPSQQPWVNGPIKAEIQIDDEKYDAQGNKTQDDLATSTDGFGNVRLAFRLPKAIQQGQGTVSLKMQGSDGSETWSHPLRIETGSVQIDCYPEGGDLIADAPNYLYFQVRNQHGEAVDGDVELLDSKQQPILTANTFHDETEAKASRGMGVFCFTPKAQESYHLRMKKPAGTQEKTLLPTAKPSGVTMHIEKSVMPAGAPLLLELSNRGKVRELAVSVYCRDVLIALDRLKMGANVTQQIMIEAIKPLAGVYSVTVAEIVPQNNSWQLIPLAERLVYRQPTRQLQLNLKADQKPGKQFKLQIDARTETNQPSAAYVTIMGVNQSLLQLAESTTNRKLPAHFLIANEVRQPEELEFADFFLSAHPSAAKALDLLLGVQGWRRFKEADSPAVMDQLAKNALPIRFYDNRDKVEEIVRLKVKEKVDQSPEQQKLLEAEKTLVDLKAQCELEEHKQTKGEVDQRLQLSTAQTQLQQSQESWRLFIVWFYLGSATALGVLSLAGIIAIMARRAILPLHLVCTIGALSLLGLLGTAVLWTQKPEIEKAMTVPREQPQKVDASKPERAVLGSNGMGLEPLKQATKEEALEPSFKNREASEAAGERQAMTTAKADPNRAMAFDKKDEEKRPSPSNELSRKKEDGNQKPPALANTPAPSQRQDKLNVPGIASSQSNQRYRSQQYQGPLKEQQSAGQYGQQGVNKLADPRTSVAPSSNQPSPLASGKAEEKRHSKPETRELKMQPPSPATGSPKSIGDTGRPGSDGATIGGGLGGAGLGGGGLGGGGLGGGGLKSSTPPAKDGAESMKKKDTLDATGDAERRQSGFFVREYSWKADAKPAALTQASTTWSKTVYWHPLEIVPANGKLELPIDLPPNEGVYHFEVYGHDGNGRLGAGSIDIPAPAQSVSLQTKLSRSQAKVGDVIQLDCQIQNLSSRRQPSVIAKVQLPEGTSLPPNLRQLRYAVKKAASEDSPEPTRWSVDGRELTLIWAELASGQRVKLTIDLNCNKAVEATTGTSKAYLENQEADAAVVPGVSLRIVKQ